MVEIGLRIVDHPLSRPLINFNRWYEPSELYGHQLVKNFEGLGPLQVPVRINSFGFRDIEHSKQKDDHTVRILGLGDSFTFGWGVSLEKTYLKQLEETLYQATGRPVETINTGVPGWGLNQYYICLKEFGTQFAPDIVVVGYWPDDLTGPPMDKLGSVPNARWEAESHIQKRGGPLQHSRLFNFFTYLADHIKYKNRSTRIPHLHDPQARRAEWTKNPHFLIADPGKVMTAERSSLLRDHLSRINTIVTTHGASLIILFIPDYSQLFQPEFQHINRVIHATAQELGISFLDMTPIYEATERSRSNYFWPLDGHTNEVGHRAIAEALISVLCERLNKKPAACRPVSNQNS
jgi:lysophospholipase L1-like esterase